MEYFECLGQTPKLLLVAFPPLRRYRLGFRQRGSPAEGQMGKQTDSLMTRKERGKKERERERRHPGTLPIC